MAAANFLHIYTTLILQNPMSNPTSLLLVSLKKLNGAGGHATPTLHWRKTIFKYTVTKVFSFLKLSFELIDF
jgi:hypothetical protein